MEAEAILNLFDSYWFGQQNLKQHQTFSTSKTCSHENPDHQIQQGSSKPELSRIKTNHTRSMSDQLDSMASFKYDSLSPESVLSSPKLQTIFSGKDVIDFTAEASEKQAGVKQLQVLSPKKDSKRSGRKKRGSKSLSDLEFEELKGFMDLGFVFSEEDKDSSLASIIPGLQRLGKNGEEEDMDSDESVVQRPYLSEAWEVQERRKNDYPIIMNWKIPAPTNENDMKDSLKWWAHTVASTVR